MKKITWGIVGAGNIAASFAASLSQSEFSDCGAVASRDSERGGAFARKWGFRRTYMSYDELFADPDIDAVYIATPHMNHAALSVAALRAGKAVLCEKPAAVNARELQNIHECARTTGGFFMEALWTKFNPVFRKALEWIASGRIGTVQSISADFCISRPDESEEAAAGRVSNRLYDIKLAGGALLDVGIYPLNFAEMVFGAPDQVHAVGVLSDKGVDLQDSMTLTWKDGKMAVLNAGANCVSDRMGVIYGTRGFVVVENINNPQSITVYDAKYQQIEHHPCPAQLTGYEYEVVEVARCIEAGVLECPSMPHQDTVHMMELMDEMRHQMGVHYPFE